MPFVQPFEGLISMVMTKRMGRPMFAGYAWCGWSQCGEENERVGVYQRRPRRKGTVPGGEVFMQKKENFVMRHTWPINPQTVPQQAWRTTFANGVQAWHDLTEEEKAWYRKRGTRIAKTGFCVFMSSYLKSN